MSGEMRLWHGGFPSLGPGDVLTGGHDRQLLDGCPFCEARKANTAVVAGDGSVIDAPSARPHEVYVTTDRDYARYYASLYGRGDLYRVEAVGPLTPSDEDHFLTWTTPAARVLAAYDRAVLLTNTQRRSLLRRWEVADRMAASR